MAEDNRNEDTLGSFYMGRTPPPPAPKRLLPPGVMTLVALAVLGGIVWYAYPRGAERYTTMDVPVVKADAAPVKMAPDAPGGMDVPHQDSMAFNPLLKDGSLEPEKLLPAAEQPMDKADAIASADTKPAAREEARAMMEPAGKGVEKVVSVKDVRAVPAKAEKKVEAKTADIKAAPVKADVAARTQSVAAIAGGAYAVQLGSFSDWHDVKKEWEKLSKKYASLASLEMRMVKADIAGKGTYYRLQAGSVSKERAGEICDALKADRKGCLLVKE